MEDGISLNNDLINENELDNIENSDKLKKGYPKKMICFII